MKKIIPLPFVAIGGIALVVYAVFWVKGQESWGISPALLCLVLGACLCILSLLGTTTQVDKPNVLAVRKAGFFVATAAIYALLFGRIHFVLLTVLFLFLLNIIMGKKSVTDNLIYSVTVSFSVYFVFNIAFGIRL